MFCADGAKVDILSALLHKFLSGFVDSFIEVPYKGFRIKRDIF